jgi:hypothetical protein
MAQADYHDERHHPGPDDRAPYEDEYQGDWRILLAFVAVGLWVVLASSFIGRLHTTSAPASQPATAAPATPSTENPSTANPSPAPPKGP